MDETRAWGTWADWLGVPRFTFFALLGAVIAQDQHHRRVFELLRPGLDLARERERLEAAGLDAGVRPEDLYPDALPCLRALRGAGYRIGLAGNQPARTEAVLAELGLPVDVIASSESWGVEKPSPAFFERVCEAAGLPPREIAYVGDRLDHDVLPARALGMRAVLLRRGPWGHVHAGRPEAARAELRLDSLDALPAALAGLKG